MRAARVKQLAGDFIVIVVGVLVALAVDQWREDSADDTLAEFYLGSLERDLRRDSSVLESDLTRVHMAQESAAMLDSVIAGLRDRPSPEVLDSALSALVGVVDPPYTSGTFEDLTGSGSLRLIQDSDLRARLSNYYTYVEGSRTWLQEYRQESRPQLVPLLLTTPFFESVVRGAEFSDSGATQTLEALRQEPLEAREWLRRKEMTMGSIDNVLSSILIRRTMPLLRAVGELSAQRSRAAR